ncbi:toll/interleukin-1 receptor-like protein [Durio zibethinus]|uniref:Toll/interleukin-1 receptor-like protein n=1 Tax=Durio zibethinus TaxID=66656 RepID=A0A6P5Y6G1_DURZI|nr:toll/interleukin-1 receptor-like protein [Durio zibethinus]
MLSLPSSSSHPPSSSSFSSSSSHKYDVFLSFRGEDTCPNITDHLHDALIKKGIVTFMDDPRLEPREEILQELLEAIQESWCSLIVFSKTYAFPSFCLEELVEIVEQKKKRGIKFSQFFMMWIHLIWENKREKVAEAFAKHEETYKETNDKIQKWRIALTEVANIKGWHLKNRLELQVKLITQSMTKSTLKKLNLISLSVFEDMNQNLLETLLKRYQQNYVKHIR